MPLSIPALSGRNGGVTGIIIRSGLINSRAEVGFRYRYFVSERLTLILTPWRVCLGNLVSGGRGALTSFDGDLLG